MKLYISDLSLILLAVLYLPLVLWALWKLASTPRLRRRTKVALLPVALLIAYAIPLGDVTLNSIAMKRACQKAGLHIYKRVKIEGYLDSSNSETSITELGYRFAEIPKPGFSGGKFIDALTIVHLERDQRGEIIRTELDRPKSDYEVINADATPSPQERLGSKGRTYIRNRHTREVLGEWLSFHPMHGWLDRLTLNRWFGSSLPGCNGDVLTTYKNWRAEILQPKK